MAYSKKQKAIIIANIINKYPDPEVLKVKLMASPNAYVRIAGLQIDEDWDIYEYQNFLDHNFIKLKDNRKIQAWLLIGFGTGLLITPAAGAGAVMVGTGIRKLSDIKKEKNLNKPAPKKDIDFGNRVDYDNVLNTTTESYHIVSESYDMVKMIKPELYIKSAIKKVNRCILILSSEVKHYKGVNPVNVINYTRDIKKLSKFKNYCEQVLTVGANDEELRKFVRSSYFNNIETFANSIISSGHDTVID